MRFIKPSNHAIIVFIAILILGYGNPVFSSEADTLLQYAKESKWDAIRNDMRSYIKSKNSVFYIEVPEKIRLRYWHRTRITETCRYRERHWGDSIDCDPPISSKTEDLGTVYNTKEVNERNSIITLVKKINVIIKEVVEEYIDEKNPGLDRKSEDREAKEANLLLLDLLMRLYSKQNSNPSTEYIDPDTDYREIALQLSVYLGALGRESDWYNTKEVKDTLAKNWKTFRELVLKDSYLRRTQMLLKKQNEVDNKLGFSRVQLRKEYKDAWDFIANLDPPRRTAKDINSLANLLKLDADLEDLVLEKEFSKRQISSLQSFETKKIENELLKFFSEDNFGVISQEATLRLLMTIKMGNFKDETKEKAAKVLSSLKKQDVASYQNAAQVVAKAICEEIKTFEDLENFCAGLGVWGALLLNIYSDTPGLVAVCNKNGLCAIMHKATAFVGAASPSLEQLGDRIGKNIKLKPFEEILGLSNLMGEHIKEVYLDDRAFIYE